MGNALSFLAQSTGNCVAKCLGNSDCIRNCIGPSINQDSVITNPALGKHLNSLSGVAFFQKFLPSLVTLALTIGSLFFFFVLIIGAIQWISSGGEKNALEAAKQKITNAIIGIVILFSVFAILLAVQNFFGISILTLDISPLVI